MSREALTERISVTTLGGGEVFVEFDPPCELTVAAEISEAVQGVVTRRRAGAVADPAPVAWAVLDEGGAVISVLLDREDAEQVAAITADADRAVRPLAFAPIPSGGAR